MPRIVAALAAAVGGGLVTGLPLLLAVVHVERGVTREAGVVLLALAGAAAAGCAIAGVLREARGLRARRRPAGLALLAGGAGFGGLLAVVSGPLTWLSLGSAELGGLDGDLRAGGLAHPAGPGGRVRRGPGLRRRPGRASRARRWGWRPARARWRPPP